MLALTLGGTKRETSPPRVATSRTTLLARNEYSSRASRNVVSYRVLPFL